MQREMNILEKEMKKIIKINNKKINKFKMDLSMETKIINKTKYNGEIKINWQGIKKIHKIINLK